MVAAMAEAAKYRAPGVWSLICAEWHGDGILMKQGAWSEIAASLFTTFPIGTLLIVYPEASVRSHTFNLAMWYYPSWEMGGLLVLSAALTAAGIILFFFRGRCFLSRLLRLLGGGLGCSLWLSLLMIDATAFGIRDSTVYLYLLPVMLYVRTVTLAWRRWFR